jgi:hypothetical protein
MQVTDAVILPQRKLIFMSFRKLTSVMAIAAKTKMSSLLTFLQMPMPEISPSGTGILIMTVQLIKPLKNPSWEYDSTGNYQVKLLVKSQYGCVDSTIKSITVHSNPVVNISASQNPVCQEEMVKFTNNSTQSDSCIWNFQDGSLIDYSKANNSVNHSFHQSGTFYTKVKVIRALRLQSEDSIKMIIKSFAVAASAARRQWLCSAYVSFTNQSSHADSFFWFVDGTLSSSSSTLILRLLQH